MPTATAAAATATKNAVAKQKCIERGGVGKRGERGQSGEPKVRAALQTQKAKDETRRGDAGAAVNVNVGGHAKIRNTHRQALTHTHTHALAIHRVVHTRI